MLIETRASWTDLIAGVGLEIADVFNQGQEEYLVGIGNILNMTTGSGAQQNYTGKTGVGEISSFIDGDDVPGGNRFKTYTTIVNYNNYGKALEVTKLTIEDRQFASDLDEMKDLSIGANYSQDRSGAQLFNGGFATATNVNNYVMTYYGDGVPQFSTVHPTVVPGASTQSNASSTGIVFGHDNLETAMIALRLQKTDDGIPLSLNGKPMMIGAPALERKMQEETMSELTPETANNAINVYKGAGDMAISHFFATTNGGSDSAWFLVVPGRHKLYHEMRQAPKLESDVNILNKTVTFTVDARWADYSREWKRTWGSKGNLTTYSS